MKKNITKKLIIVMSLTSAMIYGNESVLANDSIQLDQSQNVYFDSFSSNTFSLQVLQTRDQFNPADLVFGGSSEFDLQRWYGDKIVEYPVGEFYQQGRGFYWNQATLDVMAQAGSWGTIFLSAIDSHIGSNSNDFYTQHAFVVLGNLDKAPVYSTLGVNTIPFGVFQGSGPWDTPLTASYFNPAQAPQISAAFYKNGWNLVATGFQNQTNFKINYAYSLYYNNTGQNFGYGLGVGYLTDLQSDSTTTWTGRSKKRRKLSHDIVDDLGSVVDLNASIQFYQFSLAAEYDQGSKKVHNNDGFPQAYAITANYTKTIAGKETVFGVTRSVAMNLKDVPTTLTGNDNLISTLVGLKNTWALNVSRLVLKNVWVGLDLQKATTNQQASQANKKANTYTATLDLTIYL